MRRRTKAALGLWAASLVTGTWTTLTMERSAAAQSPADKAAAEAIFDEGKKLFLDKKFSEACPRFESSQRLDPGVGTLLFLADCYEKEGRVASAWATFREATYAATAAGQAERAKVATERARLLEPQLYRLTLKVEGRAPGLKITRNDTEVKAETWDASLPVDPGAYTLSATAPGKKPWSTHLEIPSSAGAQVVTVPALEDDPSAARAAAAPDKSAPVAPPPPAGPPPPPPEPPGKTQRTAGIVVGVIGLAGLAVGGALAGVASSKWSSAKNACPAVPPCGNMSSIDGAAQAGSLADAATALFAVGGAALASGIIVFATAPRAPRATQPTTGRAWITPTFGPGAAGLTAGGSFQ